MEASQGLGVGLAQSLLHPRVVEEGQGNRYGLDSHVDPNDDGGRHVDIVLPGELSLVAGMEPGPPGDEDQPEDVYCY